MKRKLRRSLLSIFAILIVLFTSIFSSFSVSAATYNLADPVYYPFTSISCLVEYAEGSEPKASFDLTYPFSISGGSDASSDSVQSNLNGSMISYDSGGAYLSSSDTVDDFSVSYLNIPFSIIDNSSNAAYISFHADNFYVVLENSDSDDPNNLGFTLRFDNLATLPFVCMIEYSVAGSDEVLTYQWDNGDGIGPGVHPDLGSAIGYGVFYIHSFNCSLLELQDGYFSSTGRIVIPSLEHYNLLAPRIRDLGSVELPDLPDPEPPPTPGYEEISPELFENYTSWIATAISGFLDFQFIPGFSMGGMLLILISFAFVIYFLKMFAGG